MTDEQLIRRVVSPTFPGGSRSLIFSGVHPVGVQVPRCIYAEVPKLCAFSAVKRSPRSTTPSTTHSPQIHHQNSTQKHPFFEKPPVKRLRYQRILFLRKNPSFPSVTLNDEDSAHAGHGLMPVVSGPDKLTGVHLSSLVYFPRVHRFHVVDGLDRMHSLRHEREFSA